MSGNNKNGCFGSNYANNILVPTKIDILKKITMIVSDNSGSTFFLNESGECYAGGYNIGGQLGLGFNENVDVPTKININNIVSAVCTGSCTIFLDINGDCWWCGCRNEYFFGSKYVGQLVIILMGILELAIVKKLLYLRKWIQIKKLLIW